jgi:hypothetical protein
MFSKEFQIGKGKGSYWHGKIQVIGPTTTFRCLRLSRPGWPRSRTSKRATTVLVRTQVTGQAGPLSSDVCVYVRVRVYVCWLCPKWKHVRASCVFSLSHEPLMLALRRAHHASIAAVVQWASRSWCWCCPAQTSQALTLVPSQSPSSAA